MKKLRHLYCLLSLLLFPFFAQGQYLDSLRRVWNDQTQPDTLRLSAMYDIAWEYLFIDPDSAFYYGHQQLKLAQKINSLPWQAASYNVIGVSYDIRSDYVGALNEYEKCSEIYFQMKDTIGIASTYSNIGLVYYNLGDYPLAIDYQLKSLALKKKMKDVTSYNSSYNNIGMIYSEMGETEMALEYFDRSLEHSEATGHEKGMALAYTNIGIIYEKQGKDSLALEYYNKSVEMDKKFGYIYGLTTSYGNIGIIYQSRGDYSTALEYYKMSLELNIELEDQQGISQNYYRIGQLYNDQRNYHEAVKSCLKANRLAREIGAKPNEKLSCECLYIAYKGLGNHAKALEYYEAYIGIRDTLVNEERSTELIRKELGFQYAQKAFADSIVFAEEQKVLDAQIALQEAEISEQKAINSQKITFIVALILGLIITIVFVIIVINRLNITREQKEIIQDQKHLVEEKQKEIIDSIHYAKRIQDAFHRAESNTNSHLPDHFVLFLPKDIVSGDFYWVFEKQNYLYVAVADCTGHGVPGAFLTLLGTSFLNEINASDEMLLPAQILDRLTDKIVRELNQEGRITDSKDGMDISLIRLDLTNHLLDWAGANNPLYHIRNGELTEIKGDRQPIGFRENRLDFTNHSMALEKGDLLYLITDGYADQFGGEQGKKFKYKTLKDMLCRIHANPPSEQKNFLKDTFVQWKGDLEQIDDVCIMGIRI